MEDRGPLEILEAFGKLTFVPVHHHPFHKLCPSDCRKLQPVREQSKCSELQTKVTAWSLASSQPQKPSTADVHKDSREVKLRSYCPS